MAHRLIVDPLPIETPKVVFDLTRLIRSVDRRFATGIDRIDLAIGLGLALSFGERCNFVHHMLRKAVRVPGALGIQVLRHLDTRWHGTGGDQRPNAMQLRLLGSRISTVLTPAYTDAADTTYVVASHSGLLRRQGLLDTLDPAGRMKRCIYLHDLIPLDYPDYQTPRSVSVFRAYLAEAARHPAQVVVNSEDTARRIARYASGHDWPIGTPVVRIPKLAPTPRPGTRPRSSLAALFSEGRPVFLCVGTIEPRKNHALLLDIWDRFSANLDQSPILLILGRRGWKVEDLVCRLDELAEKSGDVLEFNDLSDAELSYAFENATALLFPSFAEGLGIPVLEAAHHRLPVIASSLPALREVAPASTIFLDPDDFNGWTQAIQARIAGNPPKRPAS